MHQKIISAKYIMPYPGKILHNHYITVVDGVITGVQKFHTMRTSGTRSEFISLGNAVLMPGFINAHTHIELSDNKRNVKQNDYYSLLSELNSLSQNKVSNIESSKKAVENLIKGGSTTVADYASSTESAKLILERGLRSVIFIETASLKTTLASKIFDTARKIRDEISDLVYKFNEINSTDLKIPSGLAPSSLHSTSESLFAKCLSSVLTEDIRISTHLSVHPDENRLFQTNDGLFYEFYKKQFPDEEITFPPLISSMQYLNSIYEEIISDAELFYPPLFIHGNYIDEDDAEIIREIKGVVVICPYHHNFFGFAKYPFDLYKKYGIPVAIGTNSALIHENLSMLEEIRMLAKYHTNLTGEEILRMGTINGTIALNLNEEIGILAEDKRADMIAIELSKNTTPDRVVDDILFSNSQVLINITNGEILYQAT